MILNNNVISLNCCLKSHVYLIPDKKGYSLVDTSFPNFGPAIIDELRSLKINLKKIHQILITHSDWDHIGSLKYLSETLKVKAYTSKKEYDNWMKKGLKYLFIPQDVKQEMLSYKKYITPITKKNIGDFKVIYTNNFHSYGMTMYLFKKMLFAGDMVQSQSGRFMAIPVEFNVNEKTYLNYLKKFNIKGIDYICQAHGKPLQTKQLWDEFIKTIN